MAEPIKKIERLVVSEEERRRQDFAEIEQAVSEHKEAILEGIELLQGLHDRGVLPMANSLLGQADEVLAVVVRLVSQPQHAKALANLLQLALMVGSLDVKRLEPMVHGLNTGLEVAASKVDEKTKLMDLFKALNDPEINRAITMTLGLLKGMGSAFGRQE